MFRGLREPRRAGLSLSARASASAVAAFVAACLSTTIANAQDSRPWKPTRGEGASVNRLAVEINQATVGIVSGNPNATYLTIAYDLSAVLDDGNNFRVLPIIGKGGGQNIRDVRLLKGVDLGITQSVLLPYFQKTGELGNLDGKLVYIAKLFNEEMHLVVRAESGISSIEQLAGKKVNFSDIGSGTQLSTIEIFKRLGIKAEEVNMGQADAFEALKKGEIAASVLIAGKPTGANAKLKASDGFRLLPVPYAKSLQADFLPAVLTHDDYPNLIEAGQSIDTVAVGCVLFAYNWPKDTDRYERLEKFVNVFFPRLAEFQKSPRHPKWRETNLAATLPGWTRFEPAERWLQQHRPPTVVAERGQFEDFLSARGPAASRSAAVNPDERERLFQEFLRWKQARERR
jgi:TRAP transporter TAXI family solute receptor